MSAGGQTMNTIRPYVFDVLAEIGTATPEMVHERLPGLTLKKIRTSMWSACNAGLLTAAEKIERHTSYRLAIEVPQGGFAGKKERVDLFKPNRQEEAMPRYASVFDYARGITANDSTNRRQA
jgi:hypothetical protein